MPSALWETLGLSNDPQNTILRYGEGGRTTRANAFANMSLSTLPGRL